MKNINVLDEWLSGLWYTNGGSDEKQFNLAVLKLIRSNPGIILDSGEIREYILHKYEGIAEENGDIWSKAFEKAVLITNISEFVKVNRI